MKVIATINDETFEIDLRVDPLHEGQFLATLGGREVVLDMIERKPGNMTLGINSQVGFYEFYGEQGRINEVMYHNKSYRASLKNPQQEQLERLLEQFGAGLGGVSSETRILAPMPGKILGLSVKPGDKVVFGQIVLVLEAMKMENEISSTVEGLVKAVTCKVGDTVSVNDVLIEIHPPE